MNATELSGYTSSAFPAYGWTRYGNQSESLMTVSSGGIVLEANRVAGGAIWRWTWNGKQFINNGQDYGRQMQCSLSWVDSGGNTPNPTEAGDMYSVYTLPASAKHGSPMVQGATTANTLSTTTVPLEWNGGSLLGAQGGADNPVIWNDLLFAKNVELNYNNLGPVASYNSQVTLARPLSSWALVEIPIMYLTPDLNHFYTYDIRSATLLPVAVNAGGSATFVPKSAVGGVIASNSDGSFAMAVFGYTTQARGTISSFLIHNFIFLNNGDLSEQSQDTVAIEAVFNGPMNAGLNSYQSFVASGTLSQIQTLMANTLPTPALDSSIFDPNWYLNNYPDLQAAYGTDLTAATNHWLNFGIPQGRIGTLDFSPPEYLSMYPAFVAQTGANNNLGAITDYVISGRYNGRAGRYATRPEVFDAEYYLATYADLRAAFGTDVVAAQQHWLNYGVTEGRRASAQFYSQDYLKRYQDVAEAYGATNYWDAIMHYVLFGIPEGRNGA